MTSIMEQMRLPCGRTELFLDTQVDLKVLHWPVTLWTVALTAKGGRDYK